MTSDASLSGTSAPLGAVDRILQDPHKYMDQARKRQEPAAEEFVRLQLSLVDHLQDVRRDRQYKAIFLFSLFCASTSLVVAIVGIILAI